MAELGERAGNAGTEDGGKVFDARQVVSGEDGAAVQAPRWATRRAGGPSGRRRGRGGELGYNKSIMLFRMYEIKFASNIFLAFQFNYIHFPV